MRINHDANFIMFIMDELRRIQVEQKSNQWNQVLYQLQFRTGKASVKIINLHRYTTSPISAQFKNLRQTLMFIDISEFKKDYRRQVLNKNIPLSDLVLNCGRIEHEKFSVKNTKIMNILMGKVVLGRIGDYIHSEEQADSIFVQTEKKTPYQFTFQIKNYQQYQIDYQISFVFDEETSCSIPQYICCVCDKAIATLYCRQDCRFYCDTCGALRSQNRKDSARKKQFNRQLQDINRINTLPVCEQHHVKFDKFCEVCEKYLCEVCLQKGTHASSDHKIKHIQFAYQQKKQSNQMLHRNLLLKTKELLKISQKRQQQINKNYTQMRSYLQQQFKLAIQKLDTLYKQRIIAVVSDQVQLKMIEQKLLWGKTFIDYQQSQLKPANYFIIQKRYENDIKNINVNGFENTFNLRGDIDCQAFVLVGNKQSVRQYKKKTPFIHTYAQSNQNETTILINGKSRIEQTKNLISHNKAATAVKKGQLSLALQNSKLHFFKCNFSVIKFNLKVLRKIYMIRSDFIIDTIFMIAALRRFSLIGLTKRHKQLSNIKSLFNYIIQPASIMNKQIFYGFAHVPIDSKFHQEQIPNTIGPILQLLIAQKNLNKKIVLLQHLTEIIINDSRIFLSLDQQNVIHKQIQLWKGRSGRFQKIASVAWIIKKLNIIKQHQKLYDQIVERISNDQWYVNFDQSLKALQAFTQLQDQQMQDYIYTRIQRNVTLTVWEINMVYYQRITSALLQGRRFESPLWDKLQNLILGNLGMTYSLKTITDIFTCYALAKRGSDIFFQQIQKVIYLGHWYAFQLKHKILPGYEQTGQFYALLIQTYSIVKTNCNIYLDPNLLDYIYKGVSDRKTNYQKLQSFSKIIQFLPGIFEPQDQEDTIQNLLQNKKPTSVACHQIVQFYDLLASKDIELPLSLHKHLQNVLISDIKRKLLPPSVMLPICQQLTRKKYILNPKQLQQAVQENIGTSFKYLQGGQAKAVIELVSHSKFLSKQTKQHLALPYYPSQA